MAAKHSEKYKKGLEDKGYSRTSVWVPTRDKPKLKAEADRLCVIFSQEKSGNKP